jgi:hypothetical protein
MLADNATDRPGPAFPRGRRTIAMSSNHFVVSQRDSVWQFSFRGEVTGPFTSKTDAIQAAILAAGKVGDTHVEVVVHDADLRVETVWQTGQADASGG